MASPERPYQRRLLLNTISTAAGSGWAIVVSLVSLPLLVHGLGTAGFGVWVIVQTFSAVNGWVSIADIGLGTAVIKDVAGALGSGDDDGASATVSTALLLYVALGLGAGGLVSL